MSSRGASCVTVSGKGQARLGLGMGSKQLNDEERE